MPHPGIIAALAVEAALLDSSGTWLVRSGPGPERAGTAAAELVSQGATALISFGLAAGLAPDIGPGTMILPEHVILTDGRRQPTDTAWRGRLAAAIGTAAQIRYGALATTPGALTGPAEKQELFRVTGALAADMESAAIAQIAADAGLPFLAVRAIADPAGRAVPGAALAAVGATGATRPIAALTALARRPGEIIAMIGIARDGRRGLRSLRRVALLCGPGFALT